VGTEPLLFICDSASFKFCFFTLPSEFLSSWQILPAVIVVPKQDHVRRVSSAGVEPPNMVWAGVFLAAPEGGGFSALSAHKGLEMIKAVEMFIYLSVATFILFTGSSFVSVGFAFQGTLFEAVLWSLLTALGLLIGFGILGGLLRAMFGLQSLGRIGEFVVGVVAGCGVLLCVGAIMPLMLVLPTLASAAVAGAIGSTIVVVLGLFTGRLSFIGKILPRKKAKSEADPKQI